MNWLKHILIVVALLLAATPCCHAESHDGHDHDSGAAAELCASHACSCHSCDAAGPCAADFDPPMESVASTAVVLAPASAFIQLFVLSETKPVVHRAPPRIADPLQGLRTIQLLI